MCLEEEAAAKSQGSAVVTGLRPAQVLTELELPHVYHSVARNSPKRITMREKWDTFQARRPARRCAIALCWQRSSACVEILCKCSARRVVQMLGAHAVLHAGHALLRYEGTHGLQPPGCCAVT